MSELKLSIVIPCKDDYAVKDCIASIDESCEVVVVFNGSTNSFIDFVQKSVESKNIAYYNTGKANLPKALEFGIQQSKNDFIILMDSDCMFERSAIRSFYNAIVNGNQEKEVYKGRVVFLHGGALSKIIAKSRQHHTAEVLTAYKPPLAFSRKIAGPIGGYFFDSRLLWREDSDLDNRIRRAGIKIIPVKDGVIYHGAPTLKHDLRSTFRYGIGKAIADYLCIILTEVPRSVVSTFKSQGLMPALYMSFRNRIYDLGYIYMWSKLLLNKYGIEELLK